MYRDMPEELRGVVEPVVVEAGLELVDVQLRQGPRPWLLRITVDTPDGDGRVSVERCADVSKELDTQLDAADAVPGAYRLEVSSPGLDRVLTRQKDFSAACGSRVQLETRRPLEGRRRFRGMLLGFDGEVARVAVEGHEFPIPFDEVSKAKIIYEFTSADFAPAAESR